jgi:predicted sulfurtransferase
MKGFLIMYNAVRHVIVILTLVGCQVITANAQSPNDPAASTLQEAEKGKYQLIDIDNLWELYQDSSGEILLIDTRQDWEYRTGHITNAKLFPMEPTWFSRLIQRHALAQALGPDKDRILIFY